MILLDFYLDSENIYNMNGHHAYQEIKKIQADSKVMIISSFSNIRLLNTYNKSMDIKFLIKEKFTPQYLLENLDLALAS
jgi:DNA-binding NtrC family response regulator